MTQSPPFPTSYLVYGKIFDYDFQRTHFSVFNVDYGDVFDFAQHEADASIIQEVHSRVTESSKSKFENAFKKLGNNESDVCDDIHE